MVEIHGKSVKMKQKRIQQLTKYNGSYEKNAQNRLNGYDAWRCVAKNYEKKSMRKSMKKEEKNGWTMN